MGPLANFAVSAGSKQFFDSSMQNHGGRLMDFVRDNPTLTKVASIAFPPARGVIMAMEMGNQVRDVLGSSDREQATQAWGKTDGEGQSFMDRLGQFSQVAKQQQNRQREMG